MDEDGCCSSCGCDAAGAGVDEVLAALRAEADRADAAEKALDDIAALCGCPEWEYPGQVVRDVHAVIDARQKPGLKEARDVLSVVERLPADDGSVLARCRQALRDALVHAECSEVALARIADGRCGCTNSPCEVQHPVGMATAGGCKCLAELPLDKRARVRARIRQLEERLQQTAEKLVAAQIVAMNSARSRDIWKQLAMQHGVPLDMLPEEERP